MGDSELAGWRSNGGALLRDHPSPPPPSFCFWGVQDFTSSPDVHNALSRRGRVMKPGRDKPAMGAAFANDLRHRMCHRVTPVLYPTNANPLGLRRNHLAELKCAALWPVISFKPRDHQL